jgi:hypothetical protein
MRTPSGWQRVVEGVMARRALLGCVLQYATPVVIREGVLTIAVEGNHFHEQLLNDRTNRDLINQVLAEHLPGARRFDLRVASPTGGDWPINPADLSMGNLGKQRGTLRLLRAFRWFCGPSGREIVELAIGDLLRDLTEMQHEGRGVLFIRLVLFWRTITTILPIVSDGLARAVASIALLDGLARAVAKIVRVALRER